MTALHPEAKRDPICLKIVPVHLPWQGLLLPVSGFPVKEEERTPIKGFVQRLTGGVARTRDLSSEVFIQVEQSDDPAYRSLHMRHAPEWIPEVGLGVWSDREPPSAWTPEEFMNVAPGEKLRPLMYQVCRITNSSAKDSARDLILGFGPLLQIMTDDSGAYLDKTTELLLPRITSPSFTCYPFYVPLLEAKTLTSTNASQLESWFCGASAYIRESFEDKGVLIASREPLTPILQQLGGRFEEKPDPHWQIPV